MVEIDAAGLVEGDGERVGRGRDQRRGRRRDHPLAEDRSHAGETRFRGRRSSMLATSQQSGSSAKWREVGPAMGLPLLAGLRVGERR